MTLRMPVLFILALVTSATSFVADAAAESLPPTRVTNPPADDGTMQAGQGPQLEWIELGLGMMRIKPAGHVAEEPEGPAGRLTGQLLINDFNVFRFGAESGVTELEGQEDVQQDQYFAGLAFAAPIGTHTRLFLETGWLREDFAQEGSLRQMEQGMYAAVALNFTLGRRTEIGLRSRGDSLFGQRRHDNELSIMFRATESFSIGLAAVNRHVSQEDEARLYLSARYGW